MDEKTKDLLDDFTDDSQVIPTLKIVIDLERRRKNLDKELKEVKNTLAISKSNLLAKMIEAQIEKIQHEGVQASHKERIEPSVKKPDLEVCKEWLRSQGAGDLIEEKLIDKTFKAFIKDGEYEGDLPTYVNVEPFRKLSVTGIKAD